MQVQKKSNLNSQKVPTVWADHRWLTSPYQFLQSKLDKYGPTFFVKLPSLGKVLLTGDSELIKEVSQNKYLVGGLGLKILRPILGSRSSIMIDGAEHLKRKKILLSVFNQVSADHEKKLIGRTEQIISEISLGAEVKLYDVIQKILLDDIVDFLFEGVQENDLKSLKKAIVCFLHSFQSPLFIFLKFFQINMGSISPWGRFLKNRDKLIFEIKNILAKNHNSQINILHQLNELDLTEQELQEEIIALLLFGLDTTTSALSWLAFNILSRKEIYDEVQNELSYINSSLEASNNLLLNSCLMESNRITPTVTQVIRLAIEDTRIGNIHIYKGNRVYPNIYLSHHNPKNFELPHLFDMRRFLSNSSLNYSYIPFGFSSRICTGKNLSERQMKIIASILFKEKYFNLALNKNKYKPVRNNVIISPSHGLLVRRVK